MAYTSLNRRAGATPICSPAVWENVVTCFAVSRSGGSDFPASMVAPVPDAGAPYFIVPFAAGLLDKTTGGGVTSAGRPNAAAANAREKSVIEGNLSDICLESARRSTGSTSGGRSGTRLDSGCGARLMI
jgi:hypothetical protein